MCGIVKHVFVSPLMNVGFPTGTRGSYHYIAAFDHGVIGHGGIPWGNALPYRWLRVRRVIEIALFRDSTSCLGLRIRHVSRATIALDGVIVRILQVKATHLWGLCGTQLFHWAALLLSGESANFTSSNCSVVIGRALSQLFRQRMLMHDSLILQRRWISWKRDSGGGY